MITFSMIQSKITIFRLRARESCPTVLLSYLRRGGRHRLVQRRNLYTLRDRFRRLGPDDRALAVYTLAFVPLLAAIAYVIVNPSYTPSPAPAWYHSTSREVCEVIP